jgi:hypothetical protein
MCSYQPKGINKQQNSIQVSYVWHRFKTLELKSSNKKQAPWLLVRERTIPTERPPLVDEI